MSLGESPQSWSFQIKIARYRVLPVTVWSSKEFNTTDRIDLVRMLRRYLRVRPERVWGTPQSRRRVEVLKGRRGKNRSCLIFKPQFRELPLEYAVLKPTLTTKPTTSFVLQRYTSTPNELVVHCSIDNSGEHDDGK